MHHEPANELTAGKGHLFPGRIVPVVLCHKRDGVCSDRLHPGVGDGDAVGITPQVLDGIAEAVKSLPDVGAPSGIVEPVPQGSPGGRVRQGGAGSRERKLPVFIKGIEGGKELKGATELPIKMTDGRWPALEGWVKMQSVVQHADGTKTVIHYLFNKIIGSFDDFKFK